MGQFSPRDPADVARMVREDVLALVTTHDAQGYVATPLPLVAEVDGHGAVTGFIGHFARSNPHLERVRAAPRALVTFLGPQGYISPAMVSAPGWGPTWNYRFAQFEVEIVVEDERGPDAVRTLVAAMEGDAWDVSRMGARFDQLARHVAAFRARVVGMDARFKLGQDENRQTFGEIVDALGPSPLARAMLDQAVTA
ncbi:MAG TPA: FMN-binding negative transcriptional regulator [Novosphingobium sp.]|nr:FMN-binding negative transcriptional regulator [Novosphingobium sp.]